MPVVTVQLWTGRTVNQKRRLVAAITDAMVLGGTEGSRTLNAPPDSSMTSGLPSASR